MGYGASATLSVQLLRERDNTVGAIADSLSLLEYGYNLGAIVEIVDQGSLHSDLPHVLEVMRSAQFLGTHSIGAFLRAFLEEAAQLRIDEIAPSGSVIVKVTGLSKVIDALARVFDPSKRREQKEQLRHQKAMNQMRERNAHVELAMKTFKSMRGIADEVSNFNKILDQELVPYRGNRTRVVCRHVDRAPHHRDRRRAS